MEKLWRCRFCGTTIDHLTTTGNCPNCGGVGPEEVKEELPKLSFYQSARAVIFKSAGYNKVMLVANFVTAVLIVSLVLAYFKPDFRNDLQEPNVLLAIFTLALNASLNRWGVFVFAAVGFIIALTL